MKTTLNQLLILVCLLLLIGGFFYLLFWYVNFPLHKFLPALLIQNPYKISSALEDDLIFLRAEMKRKGFELPADHIFKSPYIIAPKMYPNVKSSNTSTHPSAPLKIIQCFTCPDWFTAKASENPSLYHHDFKVCPYNRCKFGNGGNHSAADVLLIFVGYLENRPPPVRRQGQIWIKCSWESPDNYGYPNKYEPWKNVFNWTFTYRTDSDIFAPVNRFAWRDRQQLLPDEFYESIARNKTKNVAWFVSHCVTSGKRELYVKEMQKHIDVDIYGGCGKLKCHGSDMCENLLTTTYRFYLSFENSLCQDYVTEKFFRSFQYRTHVIPIVRGGFDYRKYVPSEVFINTADFRSAKDLALHLKELGKDIKKYARLLKEKDRLTTTNFKMDWCDLCERLHTGTDVKVIRDIRQWSHNGTCHKPADISAG